MRLIAFGGDERMRGVLLAAGRAGWETLHIEREEDVEMPPVEAVMLPWPKSFREDKLVSAQGTLTRESVLARIPPCRAVLVGGDVADEELPHAAGAHPVPLAQIAAACRQADVIINTIPAHVLGDAALAETARDTPIIELASAPYGLEMQKAVKLGLQVCVESGLPGRYAPLDAGEALFDALTRAMGTRKEDAQCAT